jgi:ribonuclease P protein component
LKRSLSSKEIGAVLRVRPVFSESLRVFFRAAPSQKVGFAVSRSAGPAVKRNLFKRQVRAIVRVLQKNNNPFHVLIQPKIKLNKINNLSSELSTLFSKKPRYESVKNG